MIDDCKQQFMLFAALFVQVEINNKGKNTNIFKNWSNLSILSFIAPRFLFIIRKPFPNLWSQRNYSCFLPVFKQFHFTFRSWNHMEFILLCTMRYGPNCIFFQMIIQLFLHYSRVYLYCSGMRCHFSHVPNFSCFCTWYSFFLDYLSTYVTVIHILIIELYSLFQCLDRLVPLAVFLFQHFPGYSFMFPFKINFSIKLSNSISQCAGVLGEISLSLQINLGRADIFIILSCFSKK